MTDAFAEALRARHLANLTRQEFTRAVRALSMRYLERRGQLPDRSPLDSAGKRAAFALFYAPLHWLTVEAAVDALSLRRAPLTRLLDLGCGTGVCSAAWATSLPTPAPTIDGVDLHPWALDEARWTWRTCGLSGRASRMDAVAAVERLTQRQRDLRGTGIIAGWSINELDSAPRTRLLNSLQRAAEGGATVLVLEPLARGITPWWDTWVQALPPGVAPDARDVKADTALPAWLADFADSAGLSPVLGARVCAMGTRGDSQ